MPSSFELPQSISYVALQWWERLSSRELKCQQKRNSRLESRSHNQQTPYLKKGRIYSHQTKIL
jgi:hypothetical protein